MSTNNHKFHYWWEQWNVVAFYTFISVLIVTVLPLGLSIAEKIAIPLGIGMGFLFAEKVLHKTGIDVWFTPIFFAAGLAMVLGQLFAEDPSWHWKELLRHFIELTSYGFFAVLVSHLTILLPIFIMNKISRRRELPKDDHSE